MSSKLITATAMSVFVIEDSGLNAQNKNYSVFMNSQFVLYAFIGIILFLSSCEKNDPCDYMGSADDLIIDSEFMFVDAEGVATCKLTLDLDEQIEDVVTYKWNINDQISLNDNIVLKDEDEGIEQGFVKILNPTDGCFLFKEIAQDVDFSDICDYLGDEAFIEVDELVSSCDENTGAREITLNAIYKGPSSMELSYEWVMGDDISNGASITLGDGDEKKGYLKVVSNEDGCFIIKPIDVVLAKGSSTVSSIVWQDSDKGTLGVFDSLDTPLSDIRVDLLSYPEMELIQSVQTDITGTYFFEGIVSGDYLVRVEKRIGMNFVRQYVGADSSIDSDVNEDGYTIPFFLANCEDNQTIAAGFRYW